MATDSGKGAGPRTIKASEFKARCLKLMDEVADSGEEIVITKNGHPVSRSCPTARNRKRHSAVTGAGFGYLATSASPSTWSGRPSPTLTGYSIHDPARHAGLSVVAIR